MPHKHTVRTSKREYSEYTASEHWRGLRLAKLSQTGTCERCGAASELQVHHLRYRNLYDVTLADLMVLCHACHLTVHRGIDWGVIRDSSSRQEAASVSADTIGAAMSERLTREVIPSELLQSINAATLNVQRHVCGILKLNHPGDFMAWDGMKTTAKRLELITYRVGRCLRYTAKQHPRKRQRRREKDARVLAAQLDRFASPTTLRMPVGGRGKATERNRGNLTEAQ
jgi:hypothetical protein